MNKEHQEYDVALVTILEAVWGVGFMSPGGVKEVDYILQDINISSLTVLDIGCGLGGADFHIAKKYNPSCVIGLDVETLLIERCKLNAKQQNIDDITEFYCIEPGPLPIEANSIDLVFSKDSIIHIQDKLALAEDIFRVLKPGGWFAASDWLAGYEKDPSQDMLDYIEAEGLDFGLANVNVYLSALSSAGFKSIHVNDRNSWYKNEARKEHANLMGPLYDDLEDSVGKRFLRHQIDVWDKLIIAVDSGELRPTHLRARKPKK